MAFVAGLVQSAEEEVRLPGLRLLSGLFEPFVGQPDISFDQISVVCLFDIGDIVAQR